MMERFLHRKVTVMVTGIHQTETAIYELLHLLSCEEVTPMQQLRPEVKAFCDAAETLASPLLIGSPLTDDELTVVRMYMNTMYMNTLEKNVLGLPSEQKIPADQ
jgi:hypothetical protein